MDNTMSVEFLKFSSRNEWLNARKNTIGGSDAAAIIGKNPFKTNVSLWEEKTFGLDSKDISNKSYVQYGISAEPLLRELFRLDYPQYKVFYEENNLFVNPKYPWAHYSADGWLEDSNGKKGLLEIKTSEIRHPSQLGKWENKIPDNYYAQIVHGLLIMDVDFAILKSQLKIKLDNELRLQTKHYLIERTDVREDIEYLLQSEIKFCQYIEKKIKPPLILPDI